MKLYFVRHGESEANILMEFSNSGNKHPLTANGLAQARSVADSLSHLAAERVYSSPVLRARQTAQIIAESQQAQIEVNEALSEWSVGIYEGRRDSIGWALHRRVQEDWFWHGKLESKMPGGESYLEMKARFVPFIEGLLDHGNPDDKIILVAHGGLYLAMLPEVLTNIDHDFALDHLLPYTGCVEAESTADGLKCLIWCGSKVNG